MPEYFYDIVLPLRVAGAFTYRSAEPLRTGTRVLVPFSRTLNTGIVYREAQSVPEHVREIIEAIDETPLLPPGLFRLAEWMSDYYRTPLGTALFAMIPGALGVHLQTKVRRRETVPPAGLDDGLRVVLESVHSHDWMSMTELPQGVPALHRRLEELEELGLIEVWRSFDAKLKPRTANFVTLNPEPPDLSLTPGQQEAMTMFRSLGADFPLAQAADRVSYAIVKALKRKGFIQIVPRPLPPEELFAETVPPPPTVLDLTEEQSAAVMQVGEAVRGGEYRAFLLHGVTGSGKTEAYIRIIRQARELGRTALMLAPEIALTPQLVERFRSAFGEDVAVLHSHLSERGRMEQWKRIRSGRRRIVIGARSALFAPLENLGAIIVDEEHEGSYKQENDPRYHARDLALVRGRMENAAVVLGSATPSLESWRNVELGKLEKLELTHRPVGAALPTVRIVDLRLGEPGAIISPELQSAVSETLRRGEQGILFLNRRGYASFTQCTACGKLFKCPNCDISLNYHSHDLDLLCHYCGYRLPMPRKCPDCGSYMFNFGAPGTQQAEKRLKQVFPEARIMRMDSDTATGRDSYDRMFSEMKAGRVDLLLGTQMIAKGLDFPNVTLVGVLSADVSLNLPDFRAAERTFQLLTQVAGRAGRSDKPGVVIVQTFSPNAYAVRLAARQDYHEFAGVEREVRQNLFYPPFSRLARLLYSHNDGDLLARVMEESEARVARIREQCKEGESAILGPVPAPFPRLQNRYRWHITVRADNPRRLSGLVSKLEKAIPLKSGIRLSVDVDPVSLL
jgi:primosomal protein N' (replication factor Y) (superfamily II helicase)